jgi:hypothetical protein
MILLGSPVRLSKRTAISMNRKAARKRRVARTSVVSLRQHLPVTENGVVPQRPLNYDKGSLVNGRVAVDGRQYLAYPR